MKTNVLKYNVVIRNEKNSFIADVPTLGISDFGKTVEEAKKNVQKAILCHIEGLIRTNSLIPPPDAQEFYVSQSEVLAPKGFKLAF